MKKILSKATLFVRRYYPAFRTGAFVGLGVSVVLLLFITATTLTQTRKNGDDIKGVVTENANRQAESDKAQKQRDKELKRYVACIARIIIETQDKETIVRLKSLDVCQVEQVPAPQASNGQSSSTFQQPTTNSKPNPSPSASATPNQTDKSNGNSNQPGNGNSGNSAGNPPDQRNVIERLLDGVTNLIGL